MRVGAPCRLIAAILSGVVIDIGAGAHARAQDEIKLGGKRIVGGEPAEIRDHPWQVAITIRRSEGTYLCGGSIIAERWVLSASHCFRPSDAREAIRVKAGVTNYVGEGSWIAVDRVVAHEKYNSTTQEHDIALVRLATRPAGRVIPRLEAGTIAVAQPLEVTGWGTTTEGGDISKRLLKASVPYVDSATCNDPASYNGRVLSGMMCAGRREGGLDACQGDSGGPLVWRTADGPLLVGVVSFGDGCARELKYGVYTRVAVYTSWIERVLRSER